jgi:hypothetical protein
MGGGCVDARRCLEALEAVPVCVWGGGCGGGWVGEGCGGGPPSQIFLLRLSFFTPLVTKRPKKRKEKETSRSRNRGGNWKKNEVGSHQICDSTDLNVPVWGVRQNNTRRIDHHECALIFFIA